MKLEELKHIWQQQVTLLDSQRLDERQIHDLLKSRSLTALSRINRNILIEMGLVALMGLVWLYWLLNFTPEPSTAEVIGIFLFVIGSGVFYFIKYRALNSISLITNDLKSALARLIRVMGGFMKFYYWMGMLILPIAGTISFCYGFYTEMASQGGTLSGYPLSKWFVLGAVLIVFNIISVWLIRRYIRWLYGRHYAALQACMVELEEAEG